jgi:hypothetical protein
MRALKDMSIPRFTDGVYVKYFWSEVVCHHDDYEAGLVRCVFNDYWRKTSSPISVNHLIRSAVPLNTLYPFEGNGLHIYRLPSLPVLD